VFYLDAQGNYRVYEFDQFTWLVYGFGTRNSTPPDSISTLKQIHSDTVVLADGRTGCLGEGDALLSNTPGVTVAVKTADCLPILLVDGANRAVAAVHAGWRGTVRQVARRSVDAMRRAFATRPADLHAALGPGIGACCYEVGPEVSAEFGLSGRTHVNLPEVNRLQLIADGIPPTQIYISELCTHCRQDDFWSYRREKQEAGRMFSFAGVRGAVRR
jgi:polyphenol oxidase